MTKVIKQAVISAGGAGKRLRPLTEKMPKPMVAVLGKPILLWNIENFKKHGVNEFFITLHHYPSVVQDYFGDGRKFGVKIHYLVENEPLGSGGGIRHFKDDLDDTFYYLYGDTLSLVDYSKMTEDFAKKHNPIAMQTVKKTDEYADADVAELDKDKKFINIHRKPHVAKHEGAHRMRGSFILHKNIIEHIPERGEVDLGRHVLPKAMESGKNVYGYETDDFSKGIDTIEKLREVEKQLSKRAKHE